MKQLIAVYLQLLLNDGSIRTFEVSIEQFNQLRYSTAKVYAPCNDHEYVFVTYLS